MNVSGDPFKDYSAKLPMQPPPKSQTLSSLRDLGLLLGAILLLAVAIASIAYFKRRKHNRRRHHTHSQSSHAAHHGHRRRRKRRRSHRNNPTLAEVGGLPPKRPKDSQLIAPLN